MTISEKINPGEIVYCNLIFKTKKGLKVVSKHQVFGREYNSEIKTSYKKDEDKYFMAKHGLKEDATLVDVEIISRHGFKNRTNEFSVGARSEKDERQENGTFI